MEDKKINWAIIIFMYLKLIGGIIIVFYPFTLKFPFSEIIRVGGMIIALTSGLKVKFFPDFSGVIKPS